MSPNQQLSKRRRSVSFSPSVNLRLICPPPLTSEGDNEVVVDPQWLSNDEVNDMKSRAKNLSKMHYIIRTKEIHRHEQVDERSAQTTTQSTVTAIRNATRYELKGESLRGMEHLTNVNYGRKRRKIRAEAIQAAMEEQQRQQLENHHVYARIVSSASYSIIENHLQDVEAQQQKNKRKLAIVYGNKSQEALVFAKQLAAEDAKIAAAILSQDLVPSHEKEETSELSSLSRGDINSSSSSTGSSSELYGNFSTKSSFIALTWLVCFLYSVHMQVNGHDGMTKSLQVK